MRRRYAEKQNILLVNITRLGDMLQATPTIAGMKAENPNCRISVLVEKQFETICHWLPHIDEVLTADLGWTVRSLARGPDGLIDGFDYVTDLVADLRRRQFDYCLNMSSSAYTALLLKLLDIKRHGGWTSDEQGYRVIESDWAKLFACSVFHQNRRFNSINLVDVFRCSADVEKHPQNLLIQVADKELEYCREMIAQAGFTNKGPLIAVQAGASQAKRQWAPARFAELINLLVKNLDARVVLTGTKKELSIIEPIKAMCPSPNVFVAAGKTNIPQVAALLKLCQLLISGDTGPMHIAVAAGTPVLAMFLASAFAFETGPYSEGNIVLQPTVGCCPCNPNKLCSRTEDCHGTIEPAMIADLAARRLQGQVLSLPAGYADPSRVIVYRSYFDQYGFCDFAPLTSEASDPWHRYRPAYRKLWLDDIADYTVEGREAAAANTYVGSIPGLKDVVDHAQRGVQLIDRLCELVRDPRAPASELGVTNKALSELDRAIEQTGFHFPMLGTLTRMFIFAKENISGTEALDLASQTGTLYSNLERRSVKLSAYYAEL